MHKSTNAQYLQHLYKEEKLERLSNGMNGYQLLLDMTFIVLDELLSSAQFLGSLFDKIVVLFVFIFFSQAIAYMIDFML